MNDLPVFVTTFFAATLAVFAINLMLTDAFRRRQRILERERSEELREEQRHKIHRKADLQRQSLLAAGQSDNLDELAKEAFEKNAERESIKDQLNSMIEQSGLSVTIGQLVSAAIVSGAGLAGVTLLVVLSPVWALGVGLAGAAIPFVYVEIARQRRLERLRNQLPDAFDLMARVLRAGQTMTQSMQSIAQEFDAPLAYEFGYCYEQQNLGISPDVAFRDLGRRTGLLEIKIFVLSVLIQRQTGGNLAELLEKLAQVVRDRFRLRDKVKALTAEGRFQAIILLALPAIVWLGILAVNRPYALKLFDHPNLVLGTLGFMMLGAIWIRKIVNFDF